MAEVIYALKVVGKNEFLFNLLLLELLRSFCDDE